MFANIWATLCTPAKMIAILFKENLEIGFYLV